MSSPNPTPDPGTPVAGSSDHGSLLLFTLGAIAAGGILGVLAAHAPARIRLLGLFSLGFGVLMGGLLSKWATILNTRVDRRKLVVIGVAALGGLVTSVCQTVALQPPSTAVKNPLAVMLEAQLSKTNANDLPKLDPESGLNTEIPPPPGFTARVRRYLNRRVEMLGDWSSPWPELFWAGELLAGTAGAVVIAFLCRPRGTTS